MPPIPSPAERPETQPSSSTQAELAELQSRIQQPDTMRQLAVNPAVVEFVQEERGKLASLAQSIAQRSDSPVAQNIPPTLETAVAA